MSSVRRVMDPQQMGSVAQVVVVCPRAGHGGGRKPTGKRFRDESKRSPQVWVCSSGG